MALIELINVSKHSGATIALDQVNSQLLKGEVHALIGESGREGTILQRPCLIPMQDYDPQSHTKPHEIKERKC